jgi:hypothetical protein
MSASFHDLIARARERRGRRRHRQAGDAPPVHTSRRGCAEGHPDGISGRVAHPGVEGRCVERLHGVRGIHGQERPRRRIEARNAASCLRWSRASSRARRRKMRCFSSWEYSRVPHAQRAPPVLPESICRASNERAGCAGGPLACVGPVLIPPCIRQRHLPSPPAPDRGGPCVYGRRSVAPSAWGSSFPAAGLPVAGAPRRGPRHTNR